MDDSWPGRIFLNTDALPERDRFAVFCEEMFRRVIGADIVQLGSTPFHGVLDIRRAGEVAIADISTTSVDIIRNGGYLSDGNDAIVVQLWQQGLGGAQQGSHDTQIRAYDGVVIDNAKAAKISVEDVSRFWVLTIPRNKILGVRPDIGRFAGTKPSGDACFRLLFGYLEGTLAQDLGSHASARLFGSHLIDLIALALGGEGDARGIQEQSGVRAARLAAIFRTISDQITNPGLSAVSVAAKLGITPRYVHVLLEQSGETFTQYVLRKRLEKAGKLLANDAGQRRTIAAIALDVGFVDLSHFNRAFRRHFGDTPSGVRANSVLRRLKS
jgi:AraC-like DNA-binding protein